jgi:hypothetical protein
MSADIRQQFSRDSNLIPPALRQAVEPWSGEQAEPAIAEGDTITQILARLKATGNLPGSLWPLLQEITSQLPGTIQQPWRAALNIWRDQVAQGNFVPAQVIQELLRLLSLEPAALETVATGLSTADLASLQQALSEFFTEQALTPISPDEPAFDLSFSDGDALYVGNAGLLILWPFLDHFFGRLGLLRESQFVDNEARQRAIGLLQFLATGGSDFHEYQLSLNKVLCGLEPDALFDFGPPLTDEEVEEGNDLLRAVVAQAPILRDMSVDGLRGTFLLRQGALRTRDGAWLLQVERETHDVVLDRFPWSWTWIKLPWMAAPLQVEW